MMGAFPSPDALAANRRDLLAYAGEHIQRYEAVYGITSDNIEQAITSGELNETAEVGRWLFYVNVRRQLIQEPSDDNADDHPNRDTDHSTDA